MRVEDFETLTAAELEQLDGHEREAWYAYRRGKADKAAEILETYPPLEAADAGPEVKLGATPYKVGPEAAGGVPLEQQDTYTPEPADLEVDDELDAEPVETADAPPVDAGDVETADGEPGKTGRRRPRRAKADDEGGDA